MSKVFVFGVDGAAPELLFEKWLPELPTFRKLIETGISAKLNSSIPPSTITAWSSMFSGKDTSEIGVFSFTYKDKNGQTKVVDSSQVQCQRLWDLLPSNKKTVSLFVPLTYPVKPINGIIVSDFLSLGVDENCAAPSRIVERIKQFQYPEIFFDVAVGLGRHKALEIDELLKKTYQMTAMQLTLLKELLVQENWDLFIAVMIGTDRLQHMLWRHFDSAHRRYIPDSPHQQALKEYYIYLDQQLAEIIQMLPTDTAIIVASDHGMIKQEGKINLNNWLMEKGYLHLTAAAQEKIKEGKTRFQFEFVDLNRSKVYAAGAYNARIFLNKKVLGSDYQRFKKQLIQELKEITDDQGNRLNTFVYEKEEIYARPELEECPDLTVYFDDLRWACNPDLGQTGLYSWESAVGADSAGHSRQGIFILNSPEIKARGRINDIDIRQVAPTILKLMKLPIPNDITVSSII